MWVEITLLSLVKVMVIRWSARRKFLTGVPFIMKIEVAPMSAMACVTAIVIALAHSKRCNGVKQFDPITWDCHL